MTVCSRVGCIGAMLLAAEGMVFTARARLLPPAGGVLQGASSVRRPGAALPSTSHVLLPPEAASLRRWKDSRPPRARIATPRAELPSRTIEVLPVRAALPSVQDVLPSSWHALLRNEVALLPAVG